LLATAVSTSPSLLTIIPVVVLRFKFGLPAME
jgi:hypothetical protein